MRAVVGTDPEAARKVSVEIVGIIGIDSLSRTRRVLDLAPSERPHMIRAPWVPLVDLYDYAPVIVDLHATQPQNFGCASGHAVAKATEGPQPSKHREIFGVDHRHELQPR
jgi:hypothetical protein